MKTHIQRQAIIILFLFIGIISHAQTSIILVETRGGDKTYNINSGDTVVLKTWKDEKQTGAVTLNGDKIVINNTEFNLTDIYSLQFETEKSRGRALGSIIYGVTFSAIALATTGAAIFSGYTDFLFFTTIFGIPGAILLGKGISNIKHGKVFRAEKYNFSINSI